MVKSRSMITYVAVFARYYFGLHCLASGANYFLHFSQTGVMTEPTAAKFMDAITTIGLYPAVKGLELVVGILVVSGYLVPLALILEFPISVMICAVSTWSATRHGFDIHVITGAKEVGLNAFLFAAYAGYYLRIITVKSPTTPLWSPAVRADFAAFDPQRLSQEG